ncbi:MAG: amino acid adenylation domain-containing protein [Proteobacteria bacterium]|nr:amino acid adenylation domain-containing protein [Pseudomonadota bacterium]
MNTHSVQHTSLTELVVGAARRDPMALAIRGPDGTLTYGELDALANQIARCLAAMGVEPGDRVALWLDKGVRAVACMQGVLRCGAVYVPVDPMSPRHRAQACLRDCDVAAVVATTARLEQLDQLVATERCLCIDDDAGCFVAWSKLTTYSTQAIPLPPVDLDALAYILYTSGSTGTPKGVCITHRNALAFVEWAARELDVRADDRLGNHAPFHFDLSVLDLYVAFLAGAQVVIVAEGAAYSPRLLVEFIAREALTIWYSVPSVLVLMMENGGLLHPSTVLALRAIVFAGEVFPPKHLARLRQRFPSPRYLNFYGPTETNVCTFHEVRDEDLKTGLPLPIGVAASGDRVWARTAEGTAAAPGQEGELMCEGPTVMAGYWGHPPHRGVYGTGDLVRCRPDGSFDYIGRRDAMVKVRGHRIELGEIEAALIRHDGVHEAAVLVNGTGMEARIVAFIVGRDNPAPSLLQLKSHCASYVPRYMIVDEVRELSALPRTRNGKIDRLRLAELSAETPRRQVG